MDTPKPNSTPDRPKLLWIHVDCSEWDLIEKWIGTGHLPNFERLRASGGFRRLESTAELLVATPGPTTFTSQLPVETGFICWMQWRADQMKNQRATPDWVPLPIFYRKLGPLGKRVIAMDVPMAYEPEPFEGKELASWGSYDKHCKLASYPPEFAKQMQKKYSKLPIGPELGELNLIERQLQLRDQIVAGTQASGDAICDLLQEEDWDLFIAGLGGTHRAGHNFWDRASIREYDPPADLAAEYDNALRDVYVAADKQIGRWLDVIGDDVAVMALATHGMQPTQARYDIFDNLFFPVLNNFKAEPVDPDAQPKKGLLKRLRYMVPVEWRSAVKRRLPHAVQESLEAFWKGGNKTDWSQVQAFVAPGDLEAYVYVNLQGREAQGSVKPEEYEPLLERLTTGLMTWKDEKTGQPIIKKIVRGNDCWPEVPAERRHPMPDLIVVWNEDLPLMESQVMVSEEFGKVVWPKRDKVLDGRSGHHKPDGWLICRAAGVEPGSEHERAHILDLAPTAMSLLGLDPFDHMRGKPVSHGSPADTTPASRKPETTAA
ncbi:MAG: alkaline phosphatase family protein [Planctomycetota bacterium]